MLVCVYVRLCFSSCFEVSGGIEQKLGMGLANGPRGLWAYFRSDPTQGQRSSRGQGGLEIPYGHQIEYKEPMAEV